MSKKKKLSKKKPSKSSKSAASTSASKRLKTRSAKAVAATTPADIKPKEQVAIAKAKGRPMLGWVGKRPLRAVTAFPAQQVESFNVPVGNIISLADTAIWTDWPGRYPRGGLLFHGDNKDVLAHLLANGFRGKVHLIYIDPPFDSGADYVRKVTLRGPRGSAKLDGESYTLGEQIQYTDIWANDTYLQFMYERLLLLKELLAPNGSIYVHANSAKGHHLRCLLDEVFGPSAFRNEITWHYDKYQMGATRQFVDNTDRLFWYTNGETWSYNLQTEKLEKPKELLAKGWDKDKGVIVNLRNEEGKTYKIVVDSKKIDDFWELPTIAPFQCNVLGSKDDFVKVSIEDWPLDNTWLLPYIAAPSHERSGYPTQKPESLLERIISASSKPGELVLDCFSGSGTTAVAAQWLGRRWICCDINKGAIQTTVRRLRSVLDKTVRDFGQKPAKSNGSGDDKQPTTTNEPLPSQLNFTIWRVNDYDLTIQHNEAINLVCEHLGVTRTIADNFFDGTIGKKLVKIVPFGHPLSPVDLEDLRRELEARPNESRDVVVVCLGKEVAVDPWLAEWNRMRKQGDAPNKIEVIELRTDEKYGKFITHKPAKAKIEVSRSNGKTTVEIQDFLSPTIVERLQSAGGLLVTPKLNDWRAMVDSVVIDPNYDGKVFNIVLSDIPDRKDGFVNGRYQLDSASGHATLAVKITDMLGEELLTTFQV